MLDSHHGIRIFKVGGGFNGPAMQAEVWEMMEVLLGRQDPPINVGIMTMMEVANAYYARASEMEMAILEGEADGQIVSTSAISKFRKGPLRTFIEVCKRTQELGSRRVTAAQQDYEDSGRD